MSVCSHLGGSQGCSPTTTQGCAGMFLLSVSSRIPRGVTPAASRLLFCHPTWELQVVPIFVDVGVTESRE